MTGALVGPELREAVEWRPLLWQPAVAAGLSMAEQVLVPGAQVLEVGYNSGLMSCYLAATYGVEVVGYEARPEAQAEACRTAQQYGLSHVVDFRVCSARDTLNIRGQYDAVFMKSVLYHISESARYTEWVAWSASVLRPGGCLIVIENAEGGRVVRAYRRHVKGVRWASFCLMSSERLDVFRQQYQSVETRCFGRISPFFEPIPFVGSILLRLESQLLPPRADRNNYFIAAVCARSPR